MRFRRLAWLFPGLLLLSATCERTVDLNLDEPAPRLAVVSSFTDGEQLQVRVSTNRSALADNSTDYLLNATVQVYQGNQFIEKLTLVPPIDDEPPYYASAAFKPAVDVEYSIRVSAPGFPAVSAVSRIPRPIRLENLEIRSLEVIDLSGQNALEYRYSVAVTFADPSRQDNYYHLNVYQQVQRIRNNPPGDPKTEDIFQKAVFGANLNDNYQVSALDGGMLLEDTPFNGQRKTMVMPVTFRVNKDLDTPVALIAELRSASPEYFRFYSGISRQQGSPELPFSDPVIVFNNIQNGTGVFAGYSRDFLLTPVRR